MNDVAPVSIVDNGVLHWLRNTSVAGATRFDCEPRCPAENIDLLRLAGLLALTVPERYGGRSGGLPDIARVLGIIADGCASTALIQTMRLFKNAALNQTADWGPRRYAPASRLTAWRKTSCRNASISARIGHSIDSMYWLWMRGNDERRDGHFSDVWPESRIPGSHPLRLNHQIADEALNVLDARFTGLYEGNGRPSIPSGQLLGALLLQAFYTIRSERRLMEQLS